MERSLYFLASIAFAPRLQFSPDASILLFTLGVLLIYIELNRPGSILPGSAGLLVALLAIASMLHSNPSRLALLSLFASALLLLLDLGRPTSVFVALGASAGLVFGLLRLMPGSTSAVAIGCGLMLGGGTTVLTRIARRARANKGLD